MLRNSLIARGVFVMGLLGLVALSAAAPPADEHDLFAHSVGVGSGSAHPLWLACVETRDDGPWTNIFLREREGDSSWLEATSLQGPIIDITGQQGELVVLLKRVAPNAWMWLSTSANAGLVSRYGPSLPDAAEFLTLAGYRRELWALGRSIVSTTRPTATSVPAGARRPLVLYQLRGDTWVAQSAEWPADIPWPVGEDVSMAVVNERPTLAMPLDGNVIQVLQFEGGKWVKLERRAGGVAIRRIKLMALQNRPAVWTQPDAGDDVGGIIWTGGREFHLRIPQTQVPKPEDVAVTIAGDNVIRLFWGIENDKGKKKIMELRYNADGTPTNGQPAEVKPAQPRGDQMQWAIIAAAAIAAILVLNLILRRRAMMQDANRDEDDRGDSDE